MERGYSFAEASRMLGLSRRVIEGLVTAGFVEPARGPRGAWQLSFQDLVVLRAAQALAGAALPAARIARTLARLRKQLPEVPAGRLRVEAVGRTIVVREGDGRWVADTGQYLLAFDVAAERGEVRFIALQDVGTMRSQDVGTTPSQGASATPSQDASATPSTARRHAQRQPAPDWFERGLSLEDEQPDAARAAYRQAIDQDSHCTGAYANLGRLQHMAGRYDEAEALYRTAIRECPADATVLFNLAVLLEDRGRYAEAERRYREALALDPALADAHCNLGLLYERLGNARAALRHLRTYRQLARG